MDKYYQIKDGGARIILAPAMLWPHLRTPTAEEYRAAGFYPYADDQPTPPEGETVASTRYELGEDGVIHALYTYAPIVQPPRVFSKLYLRLALEKRGLDGAFDTFVDRAGYRAKWTDANELNEGYDGFTAIVAAVCEGLGIDEATRDEILSEAVAR